MKRVLMLASVASMIQQFNMPNIRQLIELGFEVDVACNFLDGNTCSEEKIQKLKSELDELRVRYRQVDFSRSVLDLGKNVTAYRQVKKLMLEHTYDFVHCHSPIGGVIARLAGRATKTKVIYTAHGFHFYKGAPLQNWLLFYPIEWICAHWTNTLITINREDYTLAQKHMHAKKVVYVPGIGVELSQFGCDSVSRAEKRKELGIPEQAVLLVSVGELNENKNHETVIKAIADLDVYYVIAGHGQKQEALQTLIQDQGMSDRIKLLGFRGDVQQIYGASDYFVFPSFREGLSVALMEAMASGLPCVVSEIRGNTDLIDEHGGALFDPHSVESCRTAIQRVMIQDGDAMRNRNLLKIRQFGLDQVQDRMNEIYQQVI